jgi:hypothetical protein
MFTDPCTPTGGAEVKVSRTFFGVSVVSEATTCPKLLVALTPEATFELDMTWNRSSLLLKPKSEEMVYLNVVDVPSPTKSDRYYLLDRHV